MPPDARHALTETEVGPRAVGECSARVQHCLYLGVVEPYAVCHHDVATEHPEALQVHERPQTGSLEVPLGIAGAR